MKAWAKTSCRISPTSLSDKSFKFSTTSMKSAFWMRSKSRSEPSEKSAIFWFQWMSFRNHHFATTTRCVLVTFPQSRKHSFLSRVLGPFTQRGLGKALSGRGRIFYPCSGYHWDHERLGRASLKWVDFTLLGFNRPYVPPQRNLARRGSGPRSNGPICRYL